MGGKLRSGFEKGKLIPGICPLVCKVVHCCVSVVATKGPFSCVVSTDKLATSGMVTAGDRLVLPRPDPKPTRL